MLAAHIDQFLPLMSLVKCLKELYTVQNIKNKILGLEIDKLTHNLCYHNISITSLLHNIHVKKNYIKKCFYFKTLKTKFWLWRLTNAQMYKGVITGEFICSRQNLLWTTEN